jgi:putative membrane protein
MILRFIVNAVALYLIAKYVPGFNHGVGIWTALIAALVFGLVNALVGPLLWLITLPLNILTLGLFSVVINYLLFCLTVWIAPNFQNTGEINPWLANLYGAVIMMLVSTLMHQSYSPPERRRQ